MMSAFAQSLDATVTPRVVLFLNHVLSAEPLAVQRLRAHAGKCIRLQLRDVPPLLSWLPSGLTLAVTPAGLLEDVPGSDARAADLLATIDLSNPARSLADAVAGRRPRIDVAGEAAFAADVSWLAEHLRWDVQDDLARLVGDGPAVQITQAGATLATGLRNAWQTLLQAVPVSQGPSAPAPTEPPQR